MGHAELTLLLVDNYDSYTYNLHQLLLAALGGRGRVLVARNDEYGSWSELVAALPPLDGVVISPGPGRPDAPADFGLCAEAYRSGLPLLGVCLGHQGLAVAFGGRVERAAPMHGRTSAVLHGGDDPLLRGVPSPFAAVRYHSLVVDRPSLPPCLLVTATSDDGAIMGLRHAELPLHGVQFHPESVCTEAGATLLANFVRIADDARATRADAPRPGCALAGSAAASPLSSPAASTASVASSAAPSPPDGAARETDPGGATSAE